MAARKPKGKPKVDVAVNEPVPQTDPEFLSSPMGFPIGWALDQMRAGNRVKRSSWVDGSYIELDFRDPGTRLLPDLRVYVAGHSGPYVANQDDLLATDWEVVQ